MSVNAERKDVRIQLVMSRTELTALDDWRARHKIWSRSDAIRKLITSGIDTGGLGGAA